MEPGLRRQGETKPVLPEAPEWFNRARIRANRRETFQTPISSRTYAARRTPAWIRTRSLVALAPVALAVAFLAGFGAHGWIGRGRNEAGPGPNVQVAAATHAAVPVPRPGAGRVAEPLNGAIPAPVPANGIEPARPALPAVREAIHRAEEPPRVAAIEAPPAAPPPLQGFELRPPGGREVVADVRIPNASWFSEASGLSEISAPDGCESGTCKVVLLKVADRKLGTALEWCSSPEAAAAQAEREGKLVFLIHVSGNFAQAGFT